MQSSTRCLEGKYRTQEHMLNTISMILHSFSMTEKADGSVR
jgi:hypothetical protein